MAFDDSRGAAEQNTADEAKWITQIYGLKGPAVDFVLDLAGVADIGAAYLAASMADAENQGLDLADSEVMGALNDEVRVEIGRVLDAAALHLATLADPVVAEAVADRVLSDELTSAMALGMLVYAIRDKVPRQARAAVEWLDGRCASRLGLGLQAEASFEMAVRLDPRWSPALISLAEFASVRGDAERGLMLLDRAGVEESDGLYRLLVTYRSSNVVQLRRNDPCWCGSGRKLKQCHRGAEQLPLARRASWLFHKAYAFLQDGPWRFDIYELAQERACDRGQDELLAAINDPLVLSAMLFEGGVLENFADCVKGVLPEDEFHLVLRWINVDRGLYEVEKVERGMGLHVRNVINGERVFVKEVLGSEQAYEGMFFVTLVLPVDDVDFGFFGGIEPVSLTQREEFIALLESMPDPLDVVEACSARLALPTLVTTTGDAMAPTTTVIKILGRKHIDKAFDRQFSRSGEQEWTAGIDGGAIAEGGTIGASLTVDGRLVTIDTLSEERTDMILDAIEDLGLEFEVVSQEVVDIAAAIAERRSNEEPAPPRPDPMDDPEMAAILEAHIRKYETDWLDMDIPALRGLTPRQAAVDPTARGDLVSLLNSFPPPAPGTMDVNRIRAALGFEV